MRTNLICMTMGYVESAHTATLFFDNHGPPFERGIDALQDLAHGFILKYADELLQSSTPYRDCCKKADSEYCPECGSQLRVKFDLEEFQSWLFALNGGTSDDWGGELPCQWWPWPNLEEILQHPKHEILYFPEHGEQMIVRALQGDEISDLPGYKEELDQYWKNYQARLSSWDRECGRTHTREQFAEFLDRHKPKNSDNYRIAAAPDDS